MMADSPSLFQRIVLRCRKPADRLNRAILRPQVVMPYGWFLDCVGEGGYEVRAVARIRIPVQREASLRGRTFKRCRSRYTGVNYMTRYLCIVMIGVRGMKLFCLTSRVGNDVAGSVRWRTAVFGSTCCKWLGVVTNGVLAGTENVRDKREHVLCLCL
jgi:hypothetical protein